MNENSATKTTIIERFEVSENPPMPSHLEVISSVYDSEQKTLVAKEQLASGSKVFTFLGNIIPNSQASTHALNIGGGLFLESLEETSFDQYTDHSCDPSCRVVFNTSKEGQIVEIYMESLRPIQPGEAITFDYCTTEFDMREQAAICDFRCSCQSSRCRGSIYGFNALSRNEQEALVESGMVTSPFLVGEFMRAALKVGSAFR